MPGKGVSLSSILDYKFQAITISFYMCVKYVSQSEMCLKFLLWLFMRCGLFLLFTKFACRELSWSELQIIFLLLMWIVEPLRRGFKIEYIYRISIDYGHCILVFEEEFFE